ncbi:hypothetical protein [Agrococcus sp. Marseille-Q4369]|uniref:hypothetical protein n=1 Tax=Agrococcus sp. Marseille-Q4369 TaxID=2810513 RepID=UPI001B8CC3FC|nr:hypothetical protein [Agrococcus sp. Marseille-Q4369]QUW19687.1 hypothetical protein JSQ78_05185 [Agrococcus sp. Marseille-Q4369]
MSPRLRIWLAALVLALPPLAIASTWLSLAPQLPEVIATHWSGADVADGFSATIPTATWLLVATSAMLVVALVLAAVTIDGRLRAMLLSCLAAVSGMLAGAFIASVGATLQAGSAEDAVLGAWLLVLLAPLALLLVPWFVHPREEDVWAGPAERMPLLLSDATEWRGELGSAVFAWLGVGVLVLGAVIALVAPETGAVALRVLLGVVMAAAGLVLLAMARIRVTIDGDALRVRGALLPVPLRTIATDRIRAVDAAVIEPMHWGGWGYRGLPGQVAIVLRSGPGIVVTTRDGSRFAVTVDGAEEGAAVLAGIVERSRQPRP